MTNEHIKEMLLELEKTDIDFTVTMTGKESKKVNGLYKPTTHEILIHNLNFKNDNQLMYTAIHEYTHHLINVRNEKNGISSQKGEKSHTTEFWAKMDDLVEKAVKQGIYFRTRSEKLKNLIEEAKGIDHEIAVLKKKLGSLLEEIREVSEEENVRLEDIYTNDLKMQKKTVLNCIGAAHVQTENIGQDMQEVLVKSLKKSPAQREAVKTAISEGKTVEQVKKQFSTNKEISKKEKLLKEKIHIEKTIGVLNQRLDYVCSELRDIEEEET